MHGIGSNANASRNSKFAAEVARVTGAYVLNCEVGDGSDDSYLMSMDQQI